MVLGISYDKMECECHSKNEIHPKHLTAGGPSFLSGVRHSSQHGLECETYPKWYCCWRNVTIEISAPKRLQPLVFQIYKVCIVFNPINSACIFLSARNDRASEGLLKKGHIHAVDRLLEEEMHRITNISVSCYRRLLECIQLSRCGHST